MTLLHAGFHVHPHGADLLRVAVVATVAATVLIVLLGLVRS